MRTRLGIGCLLCLVAVSSLQADWMRFRGPNGTGVSDDKNIPVRWSDSNILFKSQLPGSGHSSPIVVGQKVVLLCATRSERLVVCLDAIKGTQLWSAKVPGKVGKTHPKSSLASATPCSDGERIYCVFWDGSAVSLHAYDLDGKHLWERDLGSFTSQHGPGFSPIVVEGKVIINNDQDGKSSLQAFDARTGTPAWEVKRPAFRTCYSTPFVHEQGASGKELIVASTAGITGYQISDGKQLWNYTWVHTGMPLRTVGSPVMGEGLVFAAAGDGSGARNMIAVRLGGKGELSESALAWSLDGGTPYVPTVLYRSGYLYTVTDDGVAVCREAKSGKEMWRGRLGGQVSASPVLIDGKIYSLGEKGEVVVFAASPDGFKLLARNNTGEKILSSPAVALGRLYIRGDRHLICVGQPNK